MPSACGATQMSGKITEKKAALAPHAGPGFLSDVAGASKLAHLVDDTLDHVTDIGRQIFAHGSNHELQIGAAIIGCRAEGLCVCVRLDIAVGLAIELVQRPLIGGGT